jgi:hypothetical protein
MLPMFENYLPNIACLQVKRRKRKKPLSLFFVVMPLLGPNWHYSWHAVLPQVYVLLGRWNTPLWVLVCGLTSYRPVTSVVYTTVGSQFNDLLRRWYTPLWVHKFYDLLGRWYTPLWFHKLTTCCTFPLFLNKFFSFIFKNYLFLYLN